MNAWIIKTETYDPKLALEIVADQRTKGYSAWIEDEHGKAVDEELLKANKAVPTKPSARERGMAVLIWGAFAVVAIGLLYAGSFLAGD